MRLEFDIDCRESAHGLGVTVGADEQLSPGATLELLLAALAEAEGPRGITHVELFSPIELSGLRAGLLALDPERDAFELLSAREPGSRLRLHARGRLSDALRKRHDRPTAAPSLGAEVTRAKFYAELGRSAVVPGPRTQVIAGLRLLPSGARAQLELDEGHVDASRAFGIHPAILDAVLQVVCFLETRGRPGRNRVAHVGSLKLPSSSFSQPAQIVVTGRDFAGVSSWEGIVLGSQDEVLAHVTDMRLEATEHHRSRLVRGYAERIQRSVQRTLSTTELNATTDLSDAGATSLDFLRLLADLNQEWGWAPPLENLQLTVDALAALYADTDESAPSTLLFAPSPQDLDRGEGKLSYAERRLWYLERFAAVSCAYNEACAWRIIGPLDLPALRGALQSLVDRHLNLRTTFSERDGEPRRNVLPASSLDLEIVDSEEIDVAQWLADQQRRPFVIEHDPPFRARILRRSQTEHVLLLAAHHIVCDEWSISRVIRGELRETYLAEREGREPTTNRLLQAAQYGAWERRVVQGDLLDKLLDWWVKELAGIPEFLQLPTDRRRPAHQSHRGARIEFRLGPEESAAIRRFAQTRSVTPFVVLLAAYQVVLFRHSGQTSFAVGIPFSLRDTPELDATVGCLINTLPIACRLDTCESFDQLVQQVARVVGRALVHRHVPFDSIVSRLRCGRAQSHTPLVQVAFSYDEVPEKPASFGNAILVDLPFDSGRSKFDLTLTLRDAGESFVGVLEYCRDLFEAARVRQMLRHFRRTLNEMQRPILDIRGDWLLSGEERDEIHAAERGPAVPIACESFGIPERVRSASAAVALTHAGSSLSYGELAARADALAAHLHAMISSDETLIAVSIGRSSAWVVALLAITQLGRGYVPIAPLTPPRRALALIRESGIRTMLYTRADCSWSDRFEGRAIEVIETAQLRSQERVGAVVNPSATVYAITTSGSTGAPKAAAVPYVAFSNLVVWYSDELNIAAHDCVMVATSVAFDLTQKNVFAALRAGARLLIAPEGSFDPYQFIDMVESEVVTILNCTPSLLYAALEASAATKYRALRSLRIVVLGGEIVDLNRLASWIEGGNCAARVFNSYGPTECTDVCASHEIDVPADREFSSVPIGRPIWNATLQVLDRRGQRVPHGVIGQLHISGVALGQGYIPSTGQGADAFVEVDGRPTYRTGDLVWRSWNGELVFVGRVDDQVKIRGHRVNLEEVEAALRKTPGIASAAVAARRMGDNEAALVGYYVADSEIPAAALRGCLSDWIPGYMIPSTFARVASIPLTDTGKVNRGALPAPTEGNSARSERGPDNQIERALAVLWRRLLGVSSIGMRDVFFEVGGDSLLAIRLAQAVERDLGCRCRVRDVFDHPTIETLADLLSTRLQTRKVSTARIS